MSKLSLDALRMRAEAVASEELLASISGGTQNACHDSKPKPELPPNWETTIDRIARPKPPIPKL